MENKNLATIFEYCDKAQTIKADTHLQLWEEKIEDITTQILGDLAIYVKEEQEKFTPGPTDQHSSDEDSSDEDEGPSTPKTIFSFKLIGFIGMRDECAAFTRYSPLLCEMLKNNLENKLAGKCKVYISPEYVVIKIIKF